MELQAITEYVELALQLIGALSMVAAITPTPKDDNLLADVRKILNVFAMNWGQSENKVKPGDK